MTSMSRASRVDAATGPPGRRAGSSCAPTDDLLEVQEAEGAFELIEDWLRAKGFFAPGGEGLVADRYLGYGLSQTIRRTASPKPPEPCALPVAACAVRSDVHDVGNDNDELDLEIGRWLRTWAASDHAKAVEAVRAAIAHGDVYQVNLVQHLAAPFAGSLRSLAARLAPLTQANDAPLGDSTWRVFEGNGWAIVSASPELFLLRSGPLLRTWPIKGTRPLGARAELLGSAKDAAEHVMIVDLERNDLSRVCEPGTVRRPELMVAEPLAGVEHLVSTVEGTVRPGVRPAELLATLFPGGSVTGAPKNRRGRPDRGARARRSGRLDGGARPRARHGDLELALTIRTFAIADGRIHLWVGGGIVWDSDSREEVAESLVKAAPLLEAVGAPLEPGRAAPGVARR
jgi:para-aminobenzoate synthetase component 1